MFRVWFAGVLAGLMLLTLTPSAVACGFIESARNVTTFRQDAAQSTIVLFGRLENARKGPEGESTDFVILRRLKSDPTIEDRNVVRLPRYLPPLAPNAPSEFLLFGNVVDGKPDFHRGVAGSPAMADYVLGGLRIEAGRRVRLMQYSFDYLEHPDREIADDAFGEFITSTDPDIRTAAKNLSAEKLRGWLRADKTPAARLRLYAYLLSACGGGADAVLLRELLDRLLKQPDPPQFDGILTGYTILAPREGWAYAREIAKDSAASFMARYAVMRAARYFWTMHPGVVSERDLLGVLELALDQSDLADIPISYLRQWRCWKLTDRVVGLSGRKGFEEPMIQRSVLLYAIRCPDAQAVGFVSALRRTNPDRVRAYEDWLKAESDAASSQPQR